MTIIRKTWKCINCSALLVTALANSAGAVVVSDSVDRHRVTPGEPSYGMNLDGVVRLEVGEQLCTAALISDRHLLSAAHCFDADNDLRHDHAPGTVFLTVLDRAAGPMKLRFTAADVALPDRWFERSADLAVITLPIAPPPDIPRYPLCGARDEIGKTVIIAGYGSSGLGSEGITQFLDFKLAGLNRYEAAGEDVSMFRTLAPASTLIHDFDSGHMANNTLAAVGFDSDLGFGPDEVDAAEGDSGGPIFIGAAVAGVNSFGEWGFETDLLPDVTGTWGELGFSTRVSSFREFLTTATDSQVIFVPEPSSVMLLNIGITFVVLVTVRLGRNPKPSNRHANGSSGGRGLGCSLGVALRCGLVISAHGKIGKMIQKSLRAISYEECEQIRE